VSEPAEVQHALQTVSQALGPLKAQKTVTWLLDSGFDDIAVWRTIWEQQEHVVSRLYHTDRKVTFQDRQGQWHQGDIAQARGALRPLARVETSLEVKRGKQVRPKRQPVPVDLAACPLRVTCWTNVRRPGQGQLVTRDVWLVEVRVLGVGWDPWLRLPDWPVTDADSAVRIFTMNRERQECGGRFQILENLSGLGRGATAGSAGDPHLSRFGLGRGRLSLQLGGHLRMGRSATAGQTRWLLTPQRRTPGKITLKRGLSRLLEMLTTQAILSEYATEHQGLPPKIAALLRGWQPPGHL
jgi:hypothetical protein